MTHVYFDQDKIDWSAYVGSQQRGQGQQQQTGGGGVADDPKIYRGMRYVRGYGSIRNVLGSVGRFLMPIATNIMESAKKEAVSSLGNIATDLSQGRSIGETVKEHATGAAKRLGTTIEQCGKGKRKRLGYLDYN